MGVLLALGCLVAAGNHPLKIAVFDISGKVDMDQDHATMFAELLESELSARGMSVIGRGDIEAMLGMERMKDALACNTQSCLAEIGGALGVDDLLTGNIGKLGRYLVINLKRINPSAGRVLKETSRKIADGGDGQLVEAIPGLVDELYGGARTAAGVERAKSESTLRFVVEDPQRNDTSVDVYVDEQAYHCPEKIKIELPCVLRLPSGTARVVLNGKRVVKQTIAPGTTIYHLDHVDDDLGFWSLIIGGAAFIAGGSVLLAVLKDPASADRTASLVIGGVAGGLGLLVGTIGTGLGYGLSGDRDRTEVVSSKSLSLQLMPLRGGGYAGVGLSF